MKKTKIISLLLSLCLLVPTVTACKKNNDKNNNNGNKNGGYTNALTEEENKYAHVDGTLHEVNVNFDAPIGNFVVDGASDYSLVQASTLAKEAVSFVFGKVVEATGTSLQRVEAGNATITKESKYIVFGATLSDFGLTMPEYTTLNVSGYRIQNYGANVFINAYAERGYQMGAIALLRAVLGYDMFADDTVIFEKDGTVMPAIDITEKPDYDYAAPSNNISSEATYGMGYITNSSIFMDPSNDGYRWVHNILDFVTDGNGNGDDSKTSDELKAVRTDPVKKKWLSDEGNQVCFNAHGDPEAYELMVEEFVKHTKKVISQEKNRTRDTLLISQMDSFVGQVTETRCSCDACEASWNYYGGTMAGSHLQLINRVAEEVNKWLDSEEAIELFGERRTVYIGFLCYSASINAPVGVDSDGNVVLKKECSFIVDDESGEVLLDEKDKDLKCGNNVMLFYAASGANYTKPFYDVANERFYNAITRWTALGNNLYVWAYENCYHAYLYPYNSWDSTADNMRFWKSLGARFIYWEGTWENANNPSFSKLSDYIDGKLAFDVNADYQALVEKFFDNYFGEGSEYMYQYFTEVQAHCRSNEVAMGDGKVQSDLTADKTNWPINLINRWMGLIEQAEKAIEVNAGVDDTRYAALSKHLLVESLFPRFVLCNSYDDMFDQETILAMRKAYAADFAYYNTSASATHQEHYTFDVILKEWGLK